MKYNSLIAQNGLGRALLHFRCACHRPRHSLWHCRGIWRELTHSCPVPALAQIGPVRLASLALGLCLVTHVMAADQPDKALPAFHPQRVLARRAQSIGARQAQLAMEQQGLILRKQFDLVPDLMVLELADTAKSTAKPADPQALLKKIKALRASGAFAYVEPDYVLHADGVPQDSAFTDGTLWGLENTGQNGGVPGADIGARGAWSITTGSSNVVVAVIDTGIRYTHQDLASQMWRNPGEIPANGLDDDADGFIDNVYGMNAITGSGDPFDDNNHGTHVAGTIGAAAGFGPHVGVAWEVRLMACKFLSASGSGALSDAIECINFAVSKGAKVMNNSWSGGGYSQALYDAIAAARDAGVLFVAAAGNSADDADLTPHYPAAYEVENVISVAALDRMDHLASFSTYGRQSVDLGAPGVSIYSSTAGSDTDYQYFNGTSMATPHVSGVAALVLARFPDISIPELRQRLLASVVPVPALAGKCVTGGRVNACNALTVAADGIFEVAVSTSPSSPLPAGSVANLFVSVSDLAPVNNATVFAGVAGQGDLTLANDGIAPDALAGDNIYSAQFPVPASGSSLAIQLAVTAPGKLPATNVVTFAIRIAPTNDLFSARAPLLGGPVSVSSANMDASKESGEPSHGGNAGGKSVWWTWTAPVSGLVSVTTAGSSFDTLLGVYTGNSVESLTLIAGNDDSDGLTSAVQFTATAGQSYQIAVDGYSGASGAILLQITPTVGVPNDQFTSRSVLPTTALATTGSNAGATKESGEPYHAGNSGGASVWWTWTAPSNGLVAISTLGSTFDTLLAVYTGPAVNLLSPIASNDDSGDTLTSRVQFLATAGTTYQIAVDGYSGRVGNIQLNILPLPPLRMLPPERLPGGTVRIWIANADGTTLDAGRAATIEIQATANGSPGSNWTRLPGILGLVNGRLWLDDPEAASLPMRFYRAAERP
jgi:subtilisin family serine protease